MGSSHHLLVFLMFLHYAVGFTYNCVKILPDSSSSIVVEVGKNFTATCHLLEGCTYTSDDIEWRLGNLSIAKQSYHRINETAVSVTINISSDMSDWLKCTAPKESLSYKPRSIYGILLRAGYPPLKPNNLSCIAVQEDKDISPNLNCSWDPGSRNPLIDTTYTVYANVLGTVLTHKADCKQHLARFCIVNLETFPIHMVLKVWVEVKNALGSERSELQNDSSYFAKPNPPLNVQVLTEDKFPTSLVVTWKHPIDRTILKLSYAIRYRKAASDVWIEVPERFTRGYIESFRLQSLEPYTQYVVQMRCIGESNSSHWSNWSPSVTERTTEASFTYNCVKILPDSSSSIVLEVGKNFTATCHLLEGCAYTSDDIEWRLGNLSIAKQSYHRINETAVSVTVNINSDMSDWLKCTAAKESLSYKPRSIYGILLRAGYPPLKPKNLSCIAVQEDKDISPNLSCSWDPGSRNPLIDTTYTVYANVLGTVLTHKADCKQHLARFCIVNLETFPIHMVLKVWVEVKNALGSERSELQSDSSYFAKPNPPLNRKAASDVWIEVPESFTRGYIESFRLQSLEPYTQYVVQMRCIGESNSSHWSNWSPSVTESTTEASMTSITQNP